MLQFDVTYAAPARQRFNGLNVPAVLTPDPIAAALGLTNVTFFDPLTSLSTIDINNVGTVNNSATGKPYNWRTQCNFSSGGVTSASSSAGSNTITIAGSYPVYGDNYVINGVQVADFTNQSAIPTPTYVTGISGTPGSGSFTVALSQNIAAPGVANGDSIIFFFPPQPASTLSIVTQGGFPCLQITNVGQTESNYSLGTVYQIGNNTQKIGFTTGNNKSWYFAVEVAFDETVTPTFFGGGARWNAVSSYTYPGTTGGITEECDFLDCLPGNGSVALSYYLHELNGPSGPDDNTNYTDQSRGQLGTLGSITSGTGYVNGFYSNVPLYDVNGWSTSNATGILVDITVSGGGVSGIVIKKPGLRVNSSETLTCPNSYLGGSGGGFQVPVATTTTLVFSATVFHKWAHAHIVASDNSGVTVDYFWFDDMFIGSSTSLQGSIDSTATGTCSPGSDNSYNGEFTGADSNGAGSTFVIASGQLMGGGNWNSYWRNAICCQRPA